MNASTEEKLERLKTMTPAERVAVLKAFAGWSTGSNEARQWLEWAIKVAGPDGWQHLAPAWVDLT